MLVLDSFVYNYRKFLFYHISSHFFSSKVSQIVRVFYSSFRLKCYKNRQKMVTRLFVRARTKNELCAI